MQRQRLARGDAKLPFHQIEPGRRLGHGMLDLQPRVHLEKIEAVGAEAARGIDDELHRPGADIADRARRRDRRLAHRRARRLGQARRRALLDHLLMAALQRAIALEQMHDAAVRIAEHLHFDMARSGNVFLDQHAGIAERGLALARRAVERGVEVDMGVDAAHAAPAAARDRLDEHGIADLVGLLLEKLGALIVAVIARNDRRAGLGHQRLGRTLEAHRAHRQRRRADEDDSRAPASLGEIGVFRQEAVAGMQALRADPDRQRDDSLGVEIALGADADFVRLVGEAGEQGAAVGGRRQRQSPQTHPARRRDDPAGDLAAIGDEDIGEHWENSTSSRFDIAEAAAKASARVWEKWRQALRMRRAPQ